jgi:hypothetical protein
VRPFDVRFDHRRALNIYGDGKNLKVWTAVLPIKVLPNWQVITTPSPTAPTLNQQSLPAKVRQRDPSTTDGDEAKIRHKIPDPEYRIGA